MISFHGGTDLANYGVTTREKPLYLYGLFPLNIIMLPDHSFDKPPRIQFTVFWTDRQTDEQPSSINNIDVNTVSNSRRS